MRKQESEKALKPIWFWGFFLCILLIMENDSTLVVQPAGKVYKTQMIIVATFFGGILAGAYLLASNFKTFGDKKKANATWLLTILVLLFLVSTLFIPVLSKVPSLVYSGLCAALVGWVTATYQQKEVQAHLAAGGAHYSGGRVLAVVAIGLAIIVAVALIAFVLQDAAVGFS